MAFKWTCPYCNHDTTIVDSNFQSKSDDLKIQNIDGFKRLTIEWTVCPNKDCNKLSLTVHLIETIWNSNTYNFIAGKVLKSYRLLPQSFTKVFPDYIPTPIIQDYEEACAIIDLSPKASATLSRRCLQGMIRDFWGVSKNRLIDEINAIEEKVDPVTWKAIDAVRKVGNIGAHMEKDINLIVDVDTNEASMLIQLIELLVEEWYIHRYEREEKLKGIIKMSESKTAK